MWIQPNLDPKASVSLYFSLTFLLLFSSTFFSPFFSYIFFLFLSYLCIMTKAMVENNSNHGASRLSREMGDLVFQLMKACQQWTSTKSLRSVAAFETETIESTIRSTQEMFGYWGKNCFGKTNVGSKSNPDYSTYKKSIWENQPLIHDNRNFSSITVRCFHSLSLLTETVLAATRVPLIRLNSIQFNKKQNWWFYWIFHGVINRTS